MDLNDALTTASAVAASVAAAAAFLPDAAKRYAAGREIDIKGARQDLKHERPRPQG